MNKIQIVNFSLYSFCLLIILTLAGIIGITPAAAVDLVAPGSLSIPPEMIGNMTMPYFTPTSVTLHWTVNTPTADTTATYDIRYSTDLITDLNFATAKQASSKPITYSDLSTNGIERTYTVSGLVPETNYHFALKSKYENSNWSDLSDIPSMTLPPSFLGENLYYGKSSVAVSALQKFFTQQGVYSGPITGYFGPLTRSAAVVFQQKNNINPAVGFIGPITRDSIFKILTSNK